MDTSETRTVLVLGSPSSTHLRLLERLPAEAVVRFASDESAGRKVAPEAEIVLCDCLQGRELPALFPLLGRMRWLHSVAAGVDHLLFPALVASDVTLTNGRGAFKEALAEFVLAAALHFAKDVPRLARNQRQARWEPYDMEMLRGRTLGIVGFGEIGRATAALAKAFGMRILALRRRPELRDEMVDEMLPRERLAELLARSDYVVIAAALTPETRGMVDRAALSALKRSAVLINVGRGPIVDEQCLEAALRARRLRGAALDVFGTEPLPADHPLYQLDNVLVSPHTADHVAGWLERAVEIFLENFGRYLRGEELENVVDKRAGY
jgi:phosphoglycerate dehydrogenase-like enzyme